MLLSNVQTCESGAITVQRGAVDVSKRLYVIYYCTVMWIVCRVSS
jgi:hypothetical protein